MRVIRQIIYEGSRDGLDIVLNSSRPDGTMSVYRRIIEDIGGKYDNEVIMTIETFLDERRVVNCFPGVELKEER